MRKILPALVLATLVLSTLACGMFTPDPTPTPLPTETPLPTATPIPTATPEPTQTSEPTEIVEPTEESIPDFALPQGAPVSEWNGLPVMPGALTGQDDGSGYTYTINASLDEAINFYNTQLPALGWSLLAQSEGGEAVIMIYMQESAAATVSIIPLDDILMIVLVK